MKSSVIEILFLSLVLLFFPDSIVFSDTHSMKQINGNERMAIGTIQALRRNTIEVFDETDKTVRDFVYLDAAHPFRIGDRVRVYYTPHDHMVRQIRKMTSLRYSQDGQNLGYISH